MNIPAAMRRKVMLRADGRCEYCQLAQAGQEAAFHVDHIVPEADGGLTELPNLALACVSCSLRKGARRAAPDPVTRKLTRFFHPRNDDWRAHFEFEGLRVVGLTAVGRATVAALQMNRTTLQLIRAEGIFTGRHPPPGW